MTRILIFSEVRVFLPRIKIIKLSDKVGYIPDENVPALRAKLVEIEAAINKLNHAKSVLERILLRS